MNRPVHLLQSLRFLGDTMELSVDGRTLTFDLSAISVRLAEATAKERACFEISPSGYGIHWPLIDEDLSVDGLLRAAEVTSVHPAIHEPSARYRTRPKRRT